MTSPHLFHTPENNDDLLAEDSLFQKKELMESKLESSRLRST
jgi:hypothetical protein